MYTCIILSAATGVVHAAMAEPRERAEKRRDCPQATWHFQRNSLFFREVILPLVFYSPKMRKRIRNIDGHFPQFYHQFNIMNNVTGNYGKLLHERYFASY